MEIFKLLEKAHAQGLDLCQQLPHEIKRPQHLYMIALYLSLIDFSDAILRNCKSRSNISIPVIFRSFLEAYIDFKNLHNDANYLQNIEASDTKEQLRLLKFSREENNPFLADIANIRDIDDLISHEENKLKNFRARGIHVLNTYQRFEKAEMTDEYRSIYHNICAHSHNNITALISRHINIDTENNMSVKLEVLLEPDRKLLLSDFSDL